MSVHSKALQWLALLMLGTSVGPAGATGDAPSFAFEAGRIYAQPWPATVTRFPNGVTAQADIIYSQPLHFRPLRMDVYGGDAKGKPKPLIVHVHGGAWVNGTKRNGGPVQDFPSILAQYAARGFVVASVEYRLDGEAHFPAAIQDVKTAIRFLRQHAAEYGIDPARVGIFGGSAGGQLAALAATSCGVAALAPPPDKMNPDLANFSDCVQAAAPWYGVYNFATVPTPADQTGPAPYLGCTGRCSVEVLAFGSPETYVDAKDPPMLLIHGLGDKLVAVSQQREFETALRKNGVPVEAIYIPDVDHGFVGSTDAQTHAANLQAHEATLAFFQKELTR